MILLTNAAKDYISSLLNNSEKMLKVSIVKGGCSGLRYKFDLIIEKLSTDEEVKFDNTIIVIDQNALLFVAGSTLDYKKTQTGSFLIFEQGNETSKCGCGKSFNAR